MSFYARMVMAVGLPLVFALITRWVPRNQKAEVEPAADDRMLPFGVAGAIMWLIGLAVAVGGFFLLSGLNHLLARGLDGSLAPMLTIYLEWIIWCFFPGVAALLISWIVTLWWLRRTGYAGQAARIVEKGNAKTGWDGERVMHLMLLIVAVPIGLFTLPALPMHTTVTQHDVRVTHYGHVSPEVFRFVDARRAYEVDGYRLRDGSFKKRPDLLIDFVDGRRLSALEAGDGSVSTTHALASLLLQQTHLPTQHLHSKDELP